MSPPLWIVALLVLVASGYAVPYLLLAEVHAWHGAFLFWIVFGIAVWIILIAAVAKWQPEARPGPGRDGR